MSDTPRTDAWTWDVKGQDTPMEAFEKFAQQLERELNAANSRIELLESCNADVARIAKERNAALKRIRQLEEAGDSMVRWIEDYGCKHEFYPAISIWTAAKEAQP